MQAVGLQTYIWNNNIRSVLLLIGFPILLLGMVFCLTLGMIVARLLPSGYEYGGAVRANATCRTHSPRSRST